MPIFSLIAIPTQVMFLNDTFYIPMNILNKIRFNVCILMLVLGIHLFFIEIYLLII